MKGKHSIGGDDRSTKQANVPEKRRNGVGIHIHHVMQVYSKEDFCHCQQLCSLKQEIWILHFNVELHVRVTSTKEQFSSCSLNERQVEQLWDR